MKDGSLVVLSLQPQDKKGTKSHGAQDTPDETYVLTVFDKDDTIGRPYQIAVKERVLQDLAITEGDHGSILCEGLFGDPGSTRMRGTVFMRFDKSTGGMEAQKFYDLPTDLLTKGMSEKAREKVERAGDAPEFPAFEVRHVANLGDGTSLLVAEEYYSYEVTIRGQTAGGYDKTRFNSVFHNDDLIVVKFDADGNVIWSNKVIKTQHTTDADSDLSGVLVHVKGNRTFLLFNDHVANLSLKPGDHYKAYIPYGPESMTTLVTIEPDGQVLREALFGPDMLGYSFDLLRREHLPDGRLFIQAKDRSGQRFGMVTFK
ncbi:MAG: hypothetical protein JNM91_09850 [Flavobacteriales bacterium]|nr:hypothetical protein [Flavobacteriales bacterium]